MAIINRVRVLTVGKGSNAEKAEIQINDIILSYNGVLIDSAETLNN
jgi:S1-C subfamily serine protease